jgi:hypothetical protein
MLAFSTLVLLLPGIYFIGDWVGHTAGLYKVVNKNKYGLFPGRTLVLRHKDTYRVNYLQALKTLILLFNLVATLPFPWRFLRAKTTMYNKSFQRSTRLVQLVNNSGT